MRAVDTAQRGLINAIESGALFSMQPIAQDRARQIRYSRNLDFNDEVAAAYLQSQPSPEDIYSQLAKRDQQEFVRVFVG